MVYYKLVTDSDIQRSGRYFSEEPCIVLLVTASDIQRSGWSQFMMFTKTMFTGLLMVLALSGCTSMQAVENIDTKAEILNSISPGDHIHVETHDGGKYEMVVQSIDINTVKGAGREIPLDQIRTIKKKQISVLKTTGAIAGGYLAFVAIGVLLILGSIGSI